MSVFAAITIASLATFFWRALGVIFAGQINVESPGFRIAACVAYAMIGALIVKLILFPQGAIAETTLAARMIATTVTLIVFYCAKRNVALAAWAGAGAIFFLNQAIT